MKRFILFLICITMILSLTVPLSAAESGKIAVDWTVYKYSGTALTGEDAGDTLNGQKRYFVAYAFDGMNTIMKGKTASFSSAESYNSPRIAHVSFKTPNLGEGERVFLNITGYNRTVFKKGQGWITFAVANRISTSYGEGEVKYDPSVKYYANEKGEGNADPVKRVVSIDVTDLLTSGTTTLYVTSPTAGLYVEKMEAEIKKVKNDMKGFYEKGSFAKSYNPIVKRGADSSNRAWRDGFVSGNGDKGYITSGEPYSDTFIYNYIYFNFPTAEPRFVPEVLTSQLEEARINVFNKNSGWVIRNADGSKRMRTRHYIYHPGHQLRLNWSYSDAPVNYMRWTNYETAETGVYFEDKYGEWKRTSFTSRTDDVSVTKIEKSSEGQLINMTVSIDNISDMSKATDAVTKLKYKKMVPEDASYIAQIAHYPAYEGSELFDGGFGGVTYIVAEGDEAKKSRVISSTAPDAMLLGNNYEVKIENAEAVYLITNSGRSHNMTGSYENVLEVFEGMESYALLEELVESTASVAKKYTENGKFNYDMALKPSAEIQKSEFNRFKLDLEGDEEYADYDNVKLVEAQRNNPDRINHELLERAYNQGRYALICSAGNSMPKLCGLWTGEWNPPWNYNYTVDANLNLQVSGMNTGNFTLAQNGYITFFLRNAPDFMNNAKMSYGAHDALQVPHNIDNDRGLLVQYDNSYPFQYWNAGASWCLLPIYEYWQCFGNQQIPINEYMRIDNLQAVLGVNDGGLTDEEFKEIKERGWLDLERDILLPLLTKQANLWEQIVTPRYYMDTEGNAHHDESKTKLNEGERYMIIPSYSPENKPSGYDSSLNINAAMDIGAARDGLDMVCALERSVKREGYEEAVAKWEKLKGEIADYMYDSDGALKEWSYKGYRENNNHRHLSHLYPAWPGYETRTDKELEEAANIALDNRNKYNTSDAMAGHGWIHKALVDARLKRNDTIEASLLKMMASETYYASLMSDHDANRQNDALVLDTTLGTLGVVNEALMFSNTGEIEILPALPPEWKKGKAEGLMARTRAEIDLLEWDTEAEEVYATITSLENDNAVKLGCGEAWLSAEIDGEEQEIVNDGGSRYISLTLSEGESVTVKFNLIDAKELTCITLDTKAEKEFFVNGNSTYQLEVFNEYEKVQAQSWSTDSIANGVVTKNGMLKTYLPGEFTVTCKTKDGQSLKAKITVGKTAIISYEKAEIAGIKAYDNGITSTWVPQNSMDGIAETAYASMDNTAVKYLQYELREACTIDELVAIGRHPGNEKEGTFAKRLNGAKIYASNSDMSSLGNLGGASAPLVGEIKGISATSEFIPSQNTIDTKGVKYKYYLLYFDTVNNGKNRSLAISEIGFYKKSEKVKIDAVRGEDNTLEVKIESATDASCVLIAAVYSDEKIVEKVVSDEVVLEKGKAAGLKLEGIDKTKEIRLFLWDDSMIPYVKKLTN
ncbi:MAG: glycoside hydrolase N-terminal domain-containing protein [Clostridia bacterium]|nr:glycoside hydrolase N-terminal domain-containing protein [Clostridia bacterium]